MDESWPRRGFRDAIGAIRSWPNALATVPGAALVHVLPIEWSVGVHPAVKTAWGAFGGLVFWCVILLVIQVLDAPRRQRDEARKQRDELRLALEASHADLSRVKAARPIDTAGIAARQAAAANEIRRGHK